MKKMKPERIQRKRTKGWRMPPNAKYVGRPSKFGNPFRLGGDMIYYDAGHRRKILSKWVLFEQGHLVKNKDGSVSDEVSLFRELLIDPYSREVEKEIRDKFIYIKEHLSELKGKNLACWCNKERCCHGDVLLELANK